MRKKALLLLQIVLVSAVASPQSWAEVTSRTGNSSGTVTQVTVDATGTTSVRLRKTAVDPGSEPGPMLFDGEWTFSWDTTEPASVRFEGVVHLGDYSADSHAKAFGMNFRSVQTFYDFSQHLQGTAHWDGESRRLTYRMDPQERDDGRASTVSESRPPTCVKETSRSCKVFFKSSSALEGLRLDLTFSKELNRFEGDAVLTQYSGKGMEKATSETFVTIRGDLVDR